MDDFCGSKFWDFDKLWYSPDPDFTVCFEQTALIWGPCAFLFVFLILEFWYLQNSFAKSIPWSFWNVSKLLVNFALIALTVVDLVIAIMYKNDEFESSKIYDVHIWTPIIKIVTFITAGIVLYMNKRCGLRTSGLLFMFWLLLAVVAIPQVRTEAAARDERISQDTNDDSWATYQFYSYMVYFGLSWCMALLNCFADVAPTELKPGFPKQENPCPEYGASYLSRVTFSFFDKLAFLGYKKPLVQSDMWDMRYEDATNAVTPKFLKYFQRSFKASGGTYTKTDKSGKTQQKKKQVSILGPLWNAFAGAFLFGAFLKLLNDLLIFVMPELLREIITFVSDPRVPPWKGYFFAASMFIVASSQTFLLGQHMNKMYFVGLRIRTALISAIYRKSLVISNKAKKESTVGEIVNLMSVDAQRFLELTAYLNLIWSAPLQMGLALYFLWNILGPSVLAGLAVMIILVPINGVVANYARNYQIQQMKYKDQRVKLMNEVLNGVKVLKLYAWEPSFEKKILDIRDDEIVVLRKAAILGASTTFIWTCSPFLVSLATFATYVLVDENNVLDPTTAFVSLSLFNIMRGPLAMLPMLIASLVQTMVSVQRINKFMNSEELDETLVTQEPDEKYALSIENGTFRWDDEQVTLRNIEMKVEHKELVAVVGPVGCGKSSLVSALLGELEKDSGRVNRVGTVAYVSQQAWIQNATLKDNILFGKPYDRKKYERVVEACALKADLAMLPGGDQTEIGEKGINLSGGQKQRVSLARAVYQEAEIYFLDDPLSAVDSHVGKHIFEKVIGPEGLLNNSTRLLVTHGITYLPQTDKIFVLSNGEITETGSYQQLLDKKGAFADFLLQHLQESTEQVEDLDDLKQQLITDDVDEDLRKKFERAISTVSRTRTESTTSAGTPKTMSPRASTHSREGTELRKRKSTISSFKEEDDDKKEKKEDKLIEAETAETGSVKWEVYQHYFKNVGWGFTGLTVLLNIVFQGFSVGSNLWLSEWSSSEKAREEERWRNIYLTGYGLFGFGQALFTMLCSMVFKVAAVSAANLIHAILLNNVIKAPMSFFDTTPLGRILARFSSDVQTVDIMIPILVEMLLLMGFSVVATLAVISISTPIFLVVVVPIGIIYYVVQRFYVATSRQLKRLESVSRSPIYTHFSESLTGAQTIRAYAVQTRFVDTSDNKVDYNQASSFSSGIANRWLSVRLEMVGNLIILFAALFAVIGRGSSNPTSAGLVGLSVSYAMQITQTLNWLVRMTADVETNIVAVERIKEYGEIKSEAAWVIPNEKVGKSWPEQGMVKFEDYQVRYREGLELVLHGISFTVQGGEKIGIVGRTGAGKSSLTLSLFRIIEAAAGRIMIDGQNIADMGLHTLRSRLTIIPQDPVLFSGTLRMNLDPFEAFDDDALWKCLENAHLKSFVKGLGAGLNHEITEGGDNLSVGQRQLVCLARALLRKTKVLILDEATAAVDLETDDLIQATIRTEFKECTILTIAHRLNTIVDSDKVIVLDKGKIIEFAPPQDLLRDRSSEFFSMAKDAGLVS